jgi:hypothetical protein
MREFYQKTVNVMIILIKQTLMKLHKIAEVVIEVMSYLMINVYKFLHFRLFYKKEFTGI